MSVELPMFDGGSEAEGTPSGPRGVPIPTQGPGGRFNLLNLVPAEAERVVAEFLRERGHPAYRARQIVPRLWERPVRAFDEITDLPKALRTELDAQFEQGEFGALREWLRDRLHVHGRKFTPAETLERVVGGPLDPEPYLRYLREKLGGIYGLAHSGV